MDKIAVDYRDKGVEYYGLYTREPHAGEDNSKKRDGTVDERYDFSKVKQTQTFSEREQLALKMVKEFNQVRRIMIDIFPNKDKGIKSVQKWLGGGAPNSLIIIDRDGKLFFWQQWAKPEDTIENLDKLLNLENK